VFVVVLIRNVMNCSLYNVVLSLNGLSDFAYLSFQQKILSDVIYIQIDL
jgi:hypothetical protein